MLFETLYDFFYTDVQSNCLLFCFLRFTIIELILLYILQFLFMKLTCFKSYNVLNKSIKLDILIKEYEENNCCYNHFANNFYFNGSKT